MNYTVKTVKEVAKQCMKCSNALCVKNGCPAKINIPQMIRLYQEEKFIEAFKLICEKSNLPFICSFVCDYNKLCAQGCIYNKMEKEPVYPGMIEKAIIERILDDENILDLVSSKKDLIGKSVAIVGAGPAGISCALTLRKNGYDVTLFEKEKHIGGELLYGIPQDRLNIKCVKLQMQLMKRIGISVKLNSYIDDINELKASFDYVILATGLQKETRLDLKGFDQIISGREFLKNINYYEKGFTDNVFDLKGKTLCVIGGGNTALDCLRLASRYAERVILVYRRQEEQMLVNRVELEEIKKYSNIEFRFLTNPIKYVGDERLDGVELEILELSDKLDDSGRRIPISTGNKEFIACDYVVEAIGQRVSPIFGTGTYCIGDYSYGARTVVEAMVDGKKCAEDLILLDSFND